MKHLLSILALITALPVFAGPVIYDTDMAIDDWLALLYLLKHPETEVVAITVSTSGESHCQPALDNARNLVRLAGHAEIPVACGDDVPLDGYFVFPEPWQVDSDTLSGIDLGQWLDAPVTGSASDGHAVALIHDIVSATEEPVMIVAVGPMTNIAQWLLRHPGDRTGVSELVMMGGAWEAPGNIVVPGFSDDNPNAVSEWNYYIDPVATRETLEAAGIDKVMVGLDVTNTVRLTHPFADRFKAAVSGPASQFVDQVFDKNRWFIDSGEYYFWDVMAAAVAAEPALCRGESIAVSALAEAAGEAPYLGSSDLTMPATTVRGTPRRHLKAATAGQVVKSETAAPTKICTGTDADRVFDEFIRVLTLP